MVHPLRVLKTTNPSILYNHYNILKNNGPTIKNPQGNMHQYLSSLLSTMLPTIITAGLPVPPQSTSPSYSNPQPQCTPTRERVPCLALKHHPAANLLRTYSHPAHVPRTDPAETLDANTHTEVMGPMWQGHSDPQLTADDCNGQLFISIWHPCQTTYPGH